MNSRNIFILAFLILAASCIGGSSSSGSGDSDTSLQPITKDPATGDDPRTGDGSDDLVFDFDGEYAGNCMVKAMGLTSKSCDAFITIYHDPDQQSFSMIGTMEVDMGYTYNNIPVASDPLNIVDGDLISEDGEDVGDIDENGFTVKSGASDFVKFTKTGEGQFDFEGEYHDPSYGKILVEGSLQKAP